MFSCPDFSQCKVVVVGDAMLDRYWHGDTSRISPEAPVPVVKIESKEERVGGAANVALNVRTLGAKTTLVSEIGADEVGRKLTALLQEKEVDCQFFTSVDANTTLKLRVLGRHQQLIRLDFEDKHQVAAEAILERLAPLLEGADVLILSDYGKGMLAEPKSIIEYARKKGVAVLVDPKHPDLRVYQGATLLTPNLSEFEATVGPCPSTALIEQKGEALCQQLQLQALLVTRGSQGMSLIQANGQTTHIPANAREVFDITGAGDTVIATLGACIAAKHTFVDAAQCANVAGGLSVGKLGTAAITRDEIHGVWGDRSLSREAQILSVDELHTELKARKVKGHKIVMTNGCFDILHAGHIAYLQQARALGDCLIIAVNDDHSVKRLKGNSRPINTLLHRETVLSALECVDYVIAFSEDTPQKVIAKLLPDILVKGGDYKVEDIAGAKEVMENGGEVKILSFVPGCSTTSMVEKMKQTEEAVV